MPSSPPPQIYAGDGFERASARRKDEAWLAACRDDPATLVLAMSGTLVPVVEAAEGPRLALTSLGETSVALDPEAIFLGLLDGAALFATSAGAAPGLRHVELRSVGPILPAVEAGLGAYARGLAHWHARHRFCGACGSPSEVTDAGHARRCTACAVPVFPRTDPAVIVLVTDGDRCLLGRAARFPAGMYSTLAGFVEPGESLEGALAREVHEESGITVTDIRYRASQPWPFPQSLMLGFRATATSNAITIDPDELEDAGWFARQDLAHPERRPVQLPGQDSIARSLIEEWLAEAPGGPPATR